MKMSCDLDSKIDDKTNTSTGEYMRTTGLRIIIILAPDIRIFSTVLVQRTHRQNIEMSSHQYCDRRFGALYIRVPIQ